MVYEEGEGDLLCAALPPERPAQVRNHHHHAGDVAVAVAERLDGLEEGYKRKPRHCS